MQRAAKPQRLGGGQEKEKDVPCDLGEKKWQKYRSHWSLLKDVILYIYFLFNL